jgi:L-lactate utilization protein LutB
MTQNIYVAKHNEIIAQKVIEKFKKRFFEAYYVKTKEDALNKAIELIPKSDTIAWGGSVSVSEIGLIDYITTNNYKVIDRDSAKSPEQRLYILKKSLLADTYLMGCNAITINGELVNIDAIGNRVSALMFGPRNVIVVAGLNKISEDLESAIVRARNTAAPTNMQRIAARSDKQAPCLNSGKCHDCISKDSICSHIVVTRLCNPESRIKIILVDEPLGF